VSSFSTRGIGVIGLVCLIALSACATTTRREAPLIAYRGAAPTGFSREVMYVNDGRDDSDRDAMRFLMKVREMNAASFAELINMAAALLPGTNPDRLILSEWSCHAQQTHFGNSQLGTVFANPSVSQASAG
jgi:hypothetical protein